MYSQGCTKLSRRIAHDDSLRNSSYTVVLPNSRSVEKVVGRFLERREHEHAVLHLRHTESRDTQYLALEKEFVSAHDGTLTGELGYLVRHDIAEQHDMSGVDAHAVTLHSVLNFVDDCATSSFDTQYLGGLDNMVRCCMLSHDTFTPCVNNVKLLWRVMTDLAWS